MAETMFVKLKYKINRFIKFLGVIFLNRDPLDFVRSGRVAPIVTVSFPEVLATPLFPPPPKFAEVDRYLESLPDCAVDGWPRYCPHEQRLEWTFDGDIFGSLPTAQLYRAASMAIDPHDVVAKCMTEIRATFH